MKAKVFAAEIVFVRLLLPWLAGMYVSYRDLYRPLSGLLPISMILLMVLCFVFYTGFTLNRKKYLSGMLCILAAYTGGAFCYTHADERLKKDHFSRLNAQVFLVKIIEEPRNTAKTFAVTGRVEATFIGQQKFRTSGKLQLILLKPVQTPVYGDVLLLRGKITETTRPLNPAQFNYRNWLAGKNIYHRLTAAKGYVKKVKSHQGHPIKAFALSLRENCASVLNRAMQDSEARAVAATLLLGTRTDVSSEVMEAYAETGTIHALSVSGMHLALVYFMLDQVLKQFTHRLFKRWLKPAIAGAVIWLYALLTGFSPSVLRAAVMISVFLIADASGRNTNAYNTLAFSAFLLLNFDPFLLTDVGFQLSFLSVFGLLTFQYPIYCLLPLRNLLADQLWRLCATSLAAQISTYPVALYYFHQFPVLFLPANLFLTLPVALVMYLGMALLLFRIDFLGKLTELIIVGMNAGLKWMAQLPGATIDQIWLSPIQVALITVVILCFTRAAQTFKAVWIWLALFSLFTLEALFSWKNCNMANRRLIVFYSLHSNYAAAFIHGNKATVLSDLALKDKAYQMAVKPCLDSLQVRHIKLLPVQQVPARNQVITFGNKRILVGQYEPPGVSDQQYDIVWLHQVRHVTAKFQGKPRLIVADATCSRTVTAYWEERSKSAGVPFQQLKAEPAVIIHVSQ
ncbi:hypothetical protein C7T94_12085 [Pedobacter yulinensis]|uniref:Competence protein ComEC n=1 Tax=Pedobacter yulinensis TaxID=2126353 RepID=A0A2T3HLK9_9SPHI|nr:ComEC/Rec2 family competence protein [Pedobacter yulinensis]PST83314.1 hypothetical protein C7T94_12085 [Pedobacter yulinensis]